MSINRKWNLGSALCPLCFTQNETFQHVLTCPSKDIIRIREQFIKDFRSKLHRHCKHPPLIEYLIDAIRYPKFHSPPPILVGNPRYALLIQDAYH